MTGKFWADLDAARRAIEHVAAIDVSQMNTVAEAVKRLGPIDFKTLSSTLTLAENAQRQFERLTGNFEGIPGDFPGPFPNPPPPGQFSQELAVFETRPLVSPAKGQVDPANR